MSQNLLVVKLGGHSLDYPELLQGFTADLAALLKLGMHFVIVHGGGPAINQLLERLQLESSFCNGLRVTTEQTLEAVEMALCAKVNKYLTRFFLKNSLNAAGISGQDGRLLEASQIDQKLGAVGEVTKVNSALLECLLNGGFLPIVAPLALDRQNEPLNVNADTAAGAIAGSLKASYFVLLSDVPGVINENGQVIASLNATQISRLIQSGIASGGMIPKLECCLNALKQGCKSAIILDGRQKNSLARFVVNGEQLGTVITA